MSVLPIVAAWFWLREEPDSGPASEPEPEGGGAWGANGEGRPGKAGWIADTVATLRELAGPASVGMLVATSAYMVHGLFPILATEYAGLSEAEAGLIYSFSAVFFLVGGPVFGWLIDRYGRIFGIAWRSAANIGPSVMYIAFPNFIVPAAARSF